MKKPPQPLTPELIRDVIDRTLEICLVEHTDDFIHAPLDTSLFDQPYFKPAFDRACAELGFPTYLDEVKRLTMEN